jgi:hypothetical protein
VGFLKADTGNFNRLLASAGLILVALAIVAPWLFLRDIGVLQIREADLRTYTPQARDVLVQRQDRVALIQSAMPWAALLLLGAGAMMIFFGAKGMKEFQPWEAMEARARAQQAQASIQPQTEEERQESVRDDADVAVLAEVQPPEEVVTEGADQKPSPETTPKPVLEPTEARVERRRRVRALEDEVLERLGRRSWTSYEYAPQVKVTARDAPGQRLLIDALLRARDHKRPDVVIDIVILQQSMAWGLVTGQMADRVLALVHRYERATGRRATPWLLIVVEEFDEAAAERDRGRLTAELLGDGTVSIGPASSLEWVEQAGLHNQTIFSFVTG